MAIDGGTRTDRPRRPKDRRESILTVASALFHRSGYAGTSLDDIAGEVGITAPALYRHFRSKDELYAAALEINLRQLEASVAEAAQPSDAITGLARVGVEFPTLGMLWNSDRRRRLADPDGSLDRRVVAAVSALADVFVPSTDPELAPLLARTVVAAISSTGYYRSSLPADRVREEIERALAEIIAFRPSEPLVAVRAAPEAGVRRPWESRRSSLLEAGTALVTRQGGYNAVTLEQIATDVGVAPATVYAEFSSKAELLAAALQRASSWFTAAIQQAAAGADSADDALDRSVHAYLHLITEHPYWIGPALDEMGKLPAEYLDPLQAGIDLYLDDWLTICTAVAPEDEAEAVHVRLRVALAVLDDRAVAASDRRVLSATDASTLTARIVRAS